MSDAVILFWGEAEEHWFRNALRGLTVAKSHRKRPFIVEAAYFTQPAASEKAQYRQSLDVVIEQFDGFRGEGLRSLLERLTGAKEASAR